MPNIKSAMKRDAKSKVENARNRAQKTALKTVMKKFDAAVAEGNKEAAAGTYKVAVKSVDRAAAKGLIHKNNAAHKKSTMAQKLNAMYLRQMRERKARQKWRAFRCFLSCRMGSAKHNRGTERRTDEVRKSDPVGEQPG